MPLRRYGDNRLRIHSSRTNTDDIELKAALQQLLLNLGGDAVEADVALGEDALRRLRVGCGRHCEGNVLEEKT